MQTILLIGLGKIGASIAQSLLSQGKTVIGVGRHINTISETLKNSPNFHPIQANANQLTPKQLQPFAGTIEQICIIVSPDQSTPQAYSDTYLAICQTIVELSEHLPKLQHVVFISSTSVYGQDNGEFIDINTPLIPPITATAQVLYQAEQTLQQQFGEKCTIIRPSGIYGNARLRLVTMIKNIANSSIEMPKNTWTNRIFDTDLVKIIVKVLNENQPLPVYLATDNLPVSLYEVLSWLAGEMALRVDLPPTLPTGGKRLCHNLPENWLQYGDFKQGYRAVLEHFSAQ